MTAFDTAALALSGLVRYWPLTDASGTTADDATNTADGTYTASGIAYAVDGLLPSTGGVQTSGTGEVSLPTSGLTGAGAIFGWSVATGVTRGGAGVIFRDHTTTSGTGTLIADNVLRFASTDVSPVPFTTDFITTGRHFYVFTWDTAEAELMVDGQSVQRWASTATWANIASPLHLGRNGSAAVYDAAKFRGWGALNRRMTQAEAANLFLAERRIQTNIHAVGEQTMGGVSTQAIAVPPHKHGQLLLVALAGKPDTVTSVSGVTNGWTHVKTVTGGTGSQAADTGALSIIVMAKVATEDNDVATSFSVTFNAARNHGIHYGYALIPDLAATWIDTLGSNVAWIEGISDTDTTGDLTGTTSAFSTAPTAGDTILAIGTTPSDTPTALGNVTMSATGLSGGNIATRSTQYQESSSGNDSSVAWAAWSGFSGTASSGVTVTMPFTSATNTSGAIAVILIRQAAYTGIVVPVGQAVETDTALAATVTRNLPAGTKFYLPASGTPGATPAGYGTIWDDTSQATDYPLVTTASNTALSSKAATDTNATDNWDVLLGRFISDPIAAGPIDLPIAGVIGTSESSSNADLTTQLRIAVYSGDGSTLRGELWSGYAHTAIGAGGINDADGAAIEWNTSANLVSRRLNVVPTQVIAQTGDRIVIEIGYRSLSATVTSYTGTLRIGDPTAGSDATFADSNNTTSGRTWFQFSEDLTVPRGAGNINAGLVTETDTALAATVKRGAVVTGGLATETDTALAGSTTVGIVLSDPRDLPGLLIWVSAEGQLGTSDGTSPTQWNDLSGDGNHLTAQGVNKPVWHATGGPGGGPYMDFPATAVGDDDGGYFDIPVAVWSGLTEATVLYVLKVDDNTQESGFSRMSQAPSDPNSFYTYSDGHVLDHFGSTTRYDANPATVVGGGVDTEDWHTYDARTKAAAWNSRIDGHGAVSSGVNTVSFPSDQNKSTLGSTLGSVERLFFRGAMTCFVLLDHYATPAEIAAWDVWIAANMGGGEAGTAIGGGLASETDSALAATTTAATLMPVGLATETDTALSGSAASGLVVPIGQALETDTALTATVVAGWVLAGGLATETDTALTAALVDAPEIDVTIGLALETDFALNATILLDGEEVVSEPIENDTDLLGVEDVDEEDFLADWTEVPDVVPPPPLATVSPEAWDIGIAYGAVTTVAGQRVRPFEWATRPALVDQIVMGDEDVTFIGDIRTPAPDYERVIPFTYGTGVLRLPGLDPNYDNLEQIDYLAKGTRVMYVGRNPDTGVVEKTYYRGHVIAWDMVGSTVTVQLNGYMQARLAARRRPTRLSLRRDDLFIWARNAFRRLKLPLEGEEVGILLTDQGAMKAIDYVLRLLGMASKRNGTTYTIRHDATTNKPTFEEIDTETIHYTIYFDDGPYEQDIRRDFMEEPDEFYAKGIDPKGMLLMRIAAPNLIDTPPPIYPYDGPISQDTLGDLPPEDDYQADILEDGIILMIHRLAHIGLLEWEDQPGGWDDDVTEAIATFRRNVSLEEEDEVDGEEKGIMTEALWRKLFDNDYTGYSYREARELPEAEKNWVSRLIWTSSGQVDRVNPQYDPIRSKFVVSGEVDMGVGTNRKQLHRFAKQKINEGPNYIGTVTTRFSVHLGEHTPGTTVDPENLVPPKEIEEGRNFWAPHWMGGTLFHGSMVRIRDDGREAQILLDNRFRPALEAAQVRLRNKEHAANPIRMWINDRNSNETNDRFGTGWLKESGYYAGDVEFPANEWSPFRVLAAQAGTIEELRIELVKNLRADDMEARLTDFYLALFSRETSASYLHNRVPDPSVVAAKAQWKEHRVDMRRDKRLIDHWGTPISPAGYSPGRKPDDDPKTGKLFDEGGFIFDTRGGEPFIFGLIYPKEKAYIKPGQIMWITPPGT